MRKVKFDDSPLTPILTRPAAYKIMAGYPDGRRYLCVITSSGDLACLSVSEVSKVAPIAVVVLDEASRGEAVEVAGRLRERGYERVEVE